MRDLFIEGLSIHQHLEPTPEGDLQIECDWLFFPELKTLGFNPKSIHQVQEKLLLDLIENSSPDDLSRRVLPDTEIVRDEVSVHLDPPSDIPLWGSPLELVFPYLTWEQNRVQLAFVPSLGIEIPVNPGEERGEVVEDQIRFALNRRRINRHLFDLSLLQRCRELEIKRFRWNAYPMSPKERFLREEGDEGAVEPVLREIGRRLDNVTPDPIYERDSELEQIASFLQGRRGISSILLVGESGVGKTALVQNLAVKQGDYGLKARPLYQTPGSRIVAGMSGFGEWQDRCRKMALEASGKPGKILYFGNLLEILEVGQSVSSSESIGSFFRPWLIRGQFTAIAECTPDQLSHIEQKDPRILEAFRQVKIDPPDGPVALKILKQVAARTQHRVALSPASLKRIFSLHRRYAGYSAMPGKMLHFTKRLVTQNRPAKKEKPARVTPSAINRMFALETGLPAFLLDESAPLDLEEARAWFARRIKGQDVAIRHVIDTIAGIKARLARPHRPLGSFLFVGPTGVGKTELAKTLAEYFYGSKDRLLRIDMSEYSFPGSAARLASGGPGEPEGILTSKMRDQPFSVVLLDEFEKADATVFDLFLQVLGEARLTDGSGRLADFSNAIIILTSNLGAAQFRATAAGFGDPERGIEARAIDHFVEAAKRRFRPEFFNRIGHIVPFLPLDDASVREVIVREISQLDQRDGFKNRELSLIVEDEVVDALADGGFDPRYGARPLKRSIEEKLLKPVGEYLIEHPTLEHGTLEICSFNKRTGAIDFNFYSEEEGRARSEKAKVKHWNQEIPNLRRWYQMLSNSHLVSELHSEVRRLERKVNSKPDHGDHELLANSRNMLDRLERDSGEIFQLEEQLLLTRFENSSYFHVEAVVQRAPNWNSFCDLLRDIYQWIQKSSSRVVVILTSDNPKTLSRFASVYRDVGRHYRCRIKTGFYRRKPEPEDLDSRKGGYRKPYLPDDEKEIEDLFEGRVPDNCAAIVMEFSRVRIGLRVTSEFGVHQFINRGGERSNVRMIGFMDEDFTIEDGYVADSTLLDREFQGSGLRRLWNEKELFMKDEVWGSSVDSNRVDPRELPPEFSSEAVVSLVEMTLIERALDTIRS